MKSRYSNGTVTDLGTFGGTFSNALGINSVDQVTGAASYPGDAMTHAFLYTPGVGMTDLGTLGLTSEGMSVNSAGQVTGESAIALKNFHAFLYSAGKGMVDLNTLLPTGSGWTLQRGASINDAGQITGYGINPNGFHHAFLLNPSNTTTGTNIAIQPKDPITASSPVTLSFSSVTQSGNTTLAMSTTGPPAPQGFKLGSPPVYFNLSTTAVYSGR